MDVPKLNPEMIATFSPEATAFIQLLLAKIAELEENLNQNSRNSSKPPSSDRPAVKAAHSKPVTGKKHGGQPGHPKQSRTLIPTSDCHLVIPCFPAACRNFSKPLTRTDSNPLRFELTELPTVRPEVTEYQQQRLVCRCGFST